ncbi:MerR family transcriptional regulator [Nesterenkonia sp. AN1]|uniref:MerR-like DNA binding protein n=1 Tax=Nesterenkonia aurantiaca TaxID=1436010 RepID=A0A4R7G3Y4_9MICC|nr:MULTISPECIES: MerR family transcriptional regulator [Nesterenkonia]EXF24470.1 MerR family transcriptional regulator [Nesterenkonia sp. AN1]TDS86104.1 MerR-like DNA binding protein [Nesterenkonia aurantiaca]
MSASAASKPKPAATPTERAATHVFTISEVLRELQNEFPDLTASKLRFLEERDLVEPARTASGYRKYCAADVERLRFILALQRDRYMPLDVIKQTMDAIDSGDTPEALPQAAPVGPREVTDEMAAQITGRIRPMSRKELRAHSGATRGMLDTLEKFRIIAADAEGNYSHHDLKAVKAVRVLARYGLEPKHLVNIRRSADNELDLISRAMAPHAARRDTAARARVAESSKEMLQCLKDLRGSIMDTSVEQLDKN